MSTLDNLFRATVIQRNLREESCYIQTELLSLTEFWVEEDVTKFSDCTVSKLCVTLLYVCQVSQSSSNLNQDHGFTLNRAIEFEKFAYSQGQKCYHLVID